MTRCGVALVWSNASKVAGNLGSDFFGTTSQFPTVVVSQLLPLFKSFNSSSEKTALKYPLLLTLASGIPFVELSSQNVIRVDTPDSKFTAEVPSSDCTLPYHAFRLGLVALLMSAPSISQCTIALSGSLSCFSRVRSLPT